MFSKEEIENISSLLISPLLANVQIGIEMIRGKKDIIRNFSKELFVLFVLEREIDLHLDLKEIIEIGFKPQEIEEAKKPLLFLELKYKEVDDRFMQEMTDFKAAEKEYRYILMKHPDLDRYLLEKKYSLEDGNLYHEIMWLHELMIEYVPDDLSYISGFAEDMQFYFEKYSKVVPAEILNEKIIQLFEKALNHDPHFCHFGLAWQYQFHFKDIEKAMFHYQEALKIKPKDEDIIFNIALIYDVEIKDTKLARIWYRKVLGINPKISGALNNLAWLLATEDGNYSEALEMANQALDIEEDSHYLNTKAYVLLKGFGKIEEAEKLYIDSFNISPSKNTATSLGTLYRDHLKDEKEAEKWFKKSLTLEDD